MDTFGNKTLAIALARARPGFIHSKCDNNVALTQGELDMTMIKLNDNINHNSVASDKRFNPQMKKHLNYILTEFGHNWFEKEKYIKSLGYENMDVKIFGHETKGNIISNFRWYFTKFNEFKVFQVQADASTVSELQQLKDRIKYLEETLQELGWEEPSEDKSE
jgi:hypothetical protein